MKQYIISILITIALFSCSSKKTFLSDEIKGINPYLIGQKLTFVSNTGKVNILLIEDIQDRRFPDGLGAYRNERLFVSAYRESKTVRDGTEEIILLVLAETDKHEEKIDFNISLKETYLQMAFVSFSSYQSLTTINLSTKFNSYDDALLFENHPNRRISENEIVEFYWSKSFGYVRLIQKNGVIWDLKTVD
jgi:hypothetical protein